MMTPTLLLLLLQLLLLGTLLMWDSRIVYFTVRLNETAERLNEHNVQGQVLKVKVTA